MDETWIFHCAKGVEQMRRRIPWIVAVAAILALSAVLSGCGKKDASSIVKDLDKVMSKLESYQASGTMTLHTGQQPLNYRVEVWYQKPDYYRIALTNEKRDITQIVLRNDEGVFVLTPSLKKSYRFQSDWPENQGQVYLYQTLVHSIQMDNSRQFTTDKDSYVFDVMAGNYQNGSFARQKIWLSKEDYSPKHVEVTDTNNNVMLEVNFDSFEFGKKFDSSAFDMQQNMNLPGGAGRSTTDGADVQPSETSESGEQQGEGALAPEVQESVPVIEPSPDALPEGVYLKDVSDVQLGDKMGVMLRYSGTYDFTILETLQQDQDVLKHEGIMLDLGFTIGHLSGDETKTLTWTHDGMEFRITTMDLPQDAMVRVAQSMSESEVSGK
jgi:outer membrane lipoprotein-sorting protein